MLIKIAAWCWHIIKAIMNWFRKVFTKITKIEIKDDVWNGFVQFVKFGLVGLSNTVISYATYYILVPFNVNKYVASVIGFILSVANAFYWNNSYVFKKEDEEQRSPVQAFIKLFLSYAGTGLVLHNILLWFFTSICHISDYVAPVLNLLITIPLNFVLNKFWAFRAKENKKMTKKIFDYKVCKSLAFINFIFALFIDTMALYTFYHHKKIDSLEGFAYLIVSNLCFVGFTVLTCLKFKGKKHIFSKKTILFTVKKYYPLAIVVVAVIVLAISNYDIVPIYDASLYYGSFVNIYKLYKFTLSSTIGAINLWNNLFIGTALFVSPFECFAVGRMTGTYIANTLLFAVTLVVLYKYLEGFLVKSNKWMLTLLVIVFAFMPYSFNLITYFCPDFYLQLYFIWLLYAYKKNNHLMVSFIGFLLCFTKISGALLYAVFVFLMYIVSNVVKYKKTAFKWYLPKNWPIDRFLLWICPAVLFFIGFMIKDKFLLQKFIGSATASYGLDLTDITIQQLQNYVFGYRWAILLAGFIAVVVLIVKKIKIQSIVNIEYLPHLICIIVACVVFGTFLCVFKMSHCPRYTTVNNVALILILAVSVCVLANKEIRKNIISLVFALLMISQIYITTDPAIKYLCEPLDTGNYKVYNLVRTKLISKDAQLKWLPDCLGDVYVYNEEYSVYNDLLYQTFNHFNPQKDIVMKVYNIYHYEIHAGGMQNKIYWDTKTHKRVYKKNKHTIKVKSGTFTDDKAENLKYDEFYLIVPARENADNIIKKLADKGYEVEDAFRSSSKYGFMYTYKLKKLK